MKKRMLVLLTSICMLAAAGSAAAAGMEDYNDYPNEDGTYSYYFTEQGVKVVLPEDWYENTFVDASISSATFYHKDSYDKYEEKGYEGGRLFTIGYCVNDDYKDLPSYTFLGYSEEQNVNYYVEYPTDVQAYMEDDAIRAEYEDLYAQVQDVVANIQIDVTADEDPSGTADENAHLLGGWKITTDETVSDEAQSALDKATEDLTDVSYDPIALLGTQLVSGTNYCILCRALEEGADDAPYYTLVYVYEDLSGNASIIGTHDITVGEM